MAINTWRLIILAAATTAVASCRLPTIDIGTREPIKIDPVEINMRVDVYQHDDAGPDTEEEARQELASVKENRRNRSSEVRTLKNSRWAGENHLGGLTVRKAPAGETGTWVKNTVKAENADRLYLMREEAKNRNILLGDVQKEQWRLNLENSFAGEWIEIEGKKANTYEWVQKKSDSEIR